MQCSRSTVVEQLPYCDLLRLSPFDWMICLVSLTSRPNNWASLKKEKGRVLWTFWFRVLCLFYLAKVEGGPTVFGLSALSLLFFGGWLEYYPTWKGRVLRTCSVGLCLFYLTKVEGGPTVFGLSAFAIFRWLARATSHLERQSASNLFRSTLPFLFG